MAQVFVTVSHRPRETQLERRCNGRYSTERLAAAGAAPSVGTVGDALGNALAETEIGLFKTELIRRQGPWPGLDDLELATHEWVDWHNHRRLHTACADLTPAEFEQVHYRQHPALPKSWSQHHERRDTPGPFTGRQHRRVAGATRCLRQLLEPAAAHRGVGHAWIGTPVLMLIRELNIRIIAEDTGELIRELILDPTRDYQAQATKV